MKELLNTDMCYNCFVVNALDDPTTAKCGLCANCLGYSEYPEAVKDSSTEAASLFLEKQYYLIEPRKQWALTSLTRRTAIPKPNETGICLSRYGHPVYGTLVKQGKYKDNKFGDELVDKSAEVLSPFVVEHDITALTYVPSVRSNIVPDFADRLARKLGIPCISLLEKASARQQKEMENSSIIEDEILKHEIIQKFVDIGDIASEGNPDIHTIFDFIVVFANILGDKSQEMREAVRRYLRRYADKMGNRQEQRDKLYKDIIGYIFDNSNDITKSNAEIKGILPNKSH